jgi:hypothetical protein
MIDLILALVPLVFATGALAWTMTGGARVHQHRLGRNLQPDDARLLVLEAHRAAGGLLRDHRVAGLLVAQAEVPGLAGQRLQIDGLLQVATGLAGQHAVGHQELRLADPLHGFGGEREALGAVGALLGRCLARGLGVGGITCRRRHQRRRDAQGRQRPRERGAALCQVLHVGLLLVFVRGWQTIDVVRGA